MLHRFWTLLDQATEADGGGAVVEDKGADTVAAAEVAQKDAPADKQVAAADGKAAPAAKQEEVKPIWPDDWRKHLAGEDEKEVKRVGRFATPADVYKAYRALEARLSSGELKSVLPKDAKPEEVAQWRKENGIPDAPDKYQLKLAEGLSIGEADKPIIDEFLKSAHARNMTPDQASAAVQFYFDNAARQQEAVAAKDETDRQGVLDTLNAEWGSEFRRNINLTKGIVSRFPAAVQDALTNARLPDGTALFNHPDVMRGFVAMALEIDPAGTLVPSGGGDQMKSLNERIAEIEGKMGTKAYIKDEKMQQEYRDLLNAREKVQSRK